MSVAPSSLGPNQVDPQRAPQRRAELDRALCRYRYREQEENQLWPIAVAGDFPAWPERYDLRYLLARFRLEKAAFCFDPMKAYQKALPHPRPGFVEQAGSDPAFAYWRIGGPNALSLEQVNDLAALSRKIPIDAERIERRIRERLADFPGLATAAREGQLFVADFHLLQSALRPQPLRTRDSRWREKYLPAPIGVFLEAPDFYDRRGADLVPLAIQIDQPQPMPGPGQALEYNPIYYPDGDASAWRIAKLYFEAADVSFHVGCGHVFRTHMVMEPFCLATPRQLSAGHPVRKLLRPHTRFTLRTNKAAYKYFISRKDTYFEFYAGTLEETREIAIQSYHQRSFRQLQLRRELESRHVVDAPSEYPYRDDALLWIDPIDDFVHEYVDAFYDTDVAVAGDTELRAWEEELKDPQRGAVRDLVPGDLDTKAKLADLLAQVLFTAGPGHASQHFSSNHYYRYAPAFPGAAYAPPPWREDRAHEARLRNTLPPIETATNQLRYNTFTNFQYDTFGHYDRYELGRCPRAKKPIARLQAALELVEQQIEAANRQRLLPYEFLLPSRVPNSANI